MGIVNATPDSFFDGYAQLSDRKKRDLFPEDAENYRDTDGDGTGDHTDAYPEDELRQTIDPGDTDTDGDGVPDTSDDFSNDSHASMDLDGDGYPDFFYGSYTSLINGNQVDKIDKLQDQEIKNLCLKNLKNYFNK